MSLLVKYWKSKAKHLYISVNKKSPVNSEVKFFTQHWSYLSNVKPVCFALPTERR